jgi:pilus assembly protein CpaE
MCAYETGGHPVEKNSLILLVQEDPAGAAEIRQALGQGMDVPFRLQCVEGLCTALARIAGGGVELVLLDLSLCTGRESGQPEAFLALHREAPHIPVVVLCDAHHEGLALKAMRAGAADYIIKERWAASLGSVAASAIKLRDTPVEINAGKPAPASNRGRVIAFLGAKGGVGATTVALNVAAVLACGRRVILVEMRPAFGTLAQFFGTSLLGRSLSRLLEREPTAITPAEVHACLWPYKNIPGLSLLFAPPGAGHGELGPRHAVAIVEALAGMADLVIADLPASLSDSNRAIIEHSGLLALVVERDPICVQSAKLMMRAIESWDNAPRISPVIVNRTTVVTPVALPEIDAQIGIPALGVILPEADLCLRAQNARTPLVALQPDSMVAESLIAFGETLAAISIAADRQNMLLRA